jgi:hypothetical protein
VAIAIVKWLFMAIVIVKWLFMAIVIVKWLFMAKMHLLKQLQVATMLKDCMGIKLKDIVLSNISLYHLHCNNFN